MNNIYIKVLAASAAALMTVGASAYTTVPQTGIVNMTEYPGGVNSVEINGDFQINRSAEGYASLYRNNVLVRQIPASNLADCYTFQGLDKTATGELHITFFNPDGIGRTGGSYKVTIPEGFVTDLATGEPNEALSYSWTISASEAEVTPKAGNYTSLYQFRMALPVMIGSKEVVRYSVAGDCTIESLRNEESPVNGMAITTEVEGDQAVITLAEEVTLPDTYILTIPAGLVTAYTADGTSKASVGATLTYNVTVNSAESVTIVPAEGEYEEFAPAIIEVDGVEKNYTFLLTVDEADPIKFALMGQAKLYPMNEDGSWDESTNAGSFRAVKLSATMLALQPTTGADKVISPAPGRYALVVPKGMYQTAAGQNGSFWFEYTVVPNTSFPYGIYPEPSMPVQMIQDIALAFEEGMEVVCLSNAYAILTNGIAKYTMTGRVLEENPNEIVFSLPIPLKEAGDWTFTTPTSNFSVGGRLFAVQQTFVIDPNLVSVESVGTAGGAVDVYGLDGVRIANGTETLDALAPGLYITVDGEGHTRKIVVK